MHRLVVQLAKLRFEVADLFHERLEDAIVNSGIDHSTELGIRLDEPGHHRLGESLAGLEELGFRGGAGQGGVRLGYLLLFFCGDHAKLLADGESRRNFWCLDPELIECLPQVLDSNSTKHATRHDFSLVVGGTTTKKNPQGRRSGPWGRIPIPTAIGSRLGVGKVAVNALPYWLPE